MNIERKDYSDFSCLDWAQDLRLLLNRKFPKVRSRCLCIVFGDVIQVNTQFCVEMHAVS
ncbi:hypothetical protein Patl1_31079 [Pistacia atlantica]|uniref:Uncharacterized protein n=1 Tax=Pistacia atlantica TaxID=434234 RepID=A0ACC1ACR8_9ROSI|nr:hypothetical protein Patl1_31079 [Pistacia atlantica]